MASEVKVRDQRGVIVQAGDVAVALKQGQKMGDVSALFPFLSERGLRALVEDALKRNDTASLTKISKFL